MHYIEVRTALIRDATNKVPALYDLTLYGNAPGN